MDYTNALADGKPQSPGGRFSTDLIGKKPYIVAFVEEHRLAWYA